jgi:phosphonate transport system permease protein
MQGIRYYNRSVLTVVLVGAFLWSFGAVDWSSSLFHSGGYETFKELTRAMVTPELSGRILRIGLIASWKTLAYATCGMTLAVLIGFPLGILASGTLFESAGGQWSATILFRGVLGGFRAIHELVWAWLFAAAFGLTPVAAIVAIAIPYGGVLGRIFADLLNDVPDQPLRALETSGASTSQQLFYGRVPQVMADLISYGMFRFECSVRSAAIMSFIGLGGLGYQIEISLDDLHFSEAWTFIYMLIALVVVITFWSSEVRKALTS